MAMTKQRERFTPLYMYETLSRLRTMKHVPDCIKQTVALLNAAAEQVSIGIDTGMMEPIDSEIADKVLARYAERCGERNGTDSFDVALAWFIEQPELANDKQALFCQAKFAEVCLLAAVIARIERLPVPESELN